MPAVTPPFSRAALLASPLQALTGMWLRVNCPPTCTKIVYMPFKLLVSRAPARGDIRLEQLLGKLRCSVCGQRPASARVLDQASEGDHSNAATWHVDVLP